MISEKLIDGAMDLSAKGFGLCPFMLNGVEVGRIGWEIFQSVTGLTQGELKIGAFVKSGVVQHDHGGGG